MVEDGAAHGGSVIPGETSYRPDSQRERVREAQGETQGQTMRCEAAYESVVVMKSRPMKAGNSLEDKTGTTRGDDREGWRLPKAASVAKGGSLFEGLSEIDESFIRARTVQRDGVFIGGNP